MTAYRELPEWRSDLGEVQPWRRALVAKKEFGCYFDREYFRSNVKERKHRGGLGCAVVQRLLLRPWWVERRKSRGLARES